MAKIRIDPLALETFARLFGVTAFLETVDKAIPEMEWQEREALKQSAEEQNWDFGDYDVETQLLDAKFQHWVPRFAVYSVIILLDSVVETQLFAYAGRIGRNRGSAFRPKDIAGHGIERAAFYLKQAAALDVKKDPAWRHLDNLQELRNIIVHRGGRQGDSPEQKERVNQLLHAYPNEKLELRENKYTFGGKMELWISMHLCRDFARQIEEFFKRLCKSAYLPEKGVQIES